MRTFQTENRIFKIRITTVDQYSLDCCSGVSISTLSKYLPKKLYHYTNHDFFENTISSYITFVTYCIHVNSPGGRESSFFITDVG